MGFATEIFTSEEIAAGAHPGRNNATECAECGAVAVMFNDGNVEVQCHACGSRELGYLARRFHFGVWLEHACDVEPDKVLG